MSNLTYEVFPAEVVMPDQTVERGCRVFVTDEGVIVIAERDERAVLIYKGRHATEPDLPARHTPRYRIRMKATTVDGELLAQKVGGCGCHYPRLRGISFTDAERLAAAAG